MAIDNDANDNQGSNMKPSFIYFDAGDVLIERVAKDGDNIARALGVDASEYKDLLNQVISLQTPAEIERFWNIKTLEEEYSVLHVFHTKMCEFLGVDYDDALITKLSEFRIKADFKLKAGVEEGLALLSKHFRLGVLSNALPSRRHFELKLRNIDQYFETIIISWEEGVHKPEKEIYEIAIDRCGEIPKDIMFVDNKVSYLKGAQKAGIQNIVLLSDKKNEDYNTVSHLIELSELLET